MMRVYQGAVSSDGRQAPARSTEIAEGLTRDPMFGKFSDASTEDRLEADLPEVNLPPRCRLRGGAEEPMNK